ncbi:TaqI-like C-terminal specificity domain-containing protein [Streptococcus mutans]|uniref:TaqI-like C-terminal specificity domain-containing protein n=1 Tax=Streptococcus mutans TaxID=1309 RepID=UPI0038B89E8E
MSNFQLSFLVFLQILQFQIADFLQSVYLCSPLYIHKSFLYTCFLKRSDYIEQNKIKISYRKNESWIILSQIEQSIKSKIESIGIPLKDWDISINYGIKTGYNDAFIIDTKKREEILNNCQTTNERTRTDELIRPILRGKDIRRYSYEFADKYLITTYNEYTDSNGIKHPSININDYPAVKKHLDCYWNEINKRQDKGDTPYNLRRCAYMDDFSKPKIVWADIATEPNFVQIDERIYFNNTCYMMVGAPNWFVDYLNSDLVKWYFPLTATDLGEKGTRYFKQFVEKIPIPTAFIGNIQSFFKLTDDEMNCISSSVNFNS